MANCIYPSSQRRALTQGRQGVRYHGRSIGGSIELSR
jgi:hypothetical protein